MGSRGASVGKRKLSSGTKIGAEIETARKKNSWLEGNQLQKELHS